ncbi:type II secretion system protein M [bacterium LRH843]|nr:type II secretion system protein M [bacterium LRH843]
MKWTRQHILVAVAAFFMMIGFFYWMYGEVTSPVLAEHAEVEQLLTSERELLHTLEQATGEEKRDRIRSSVGLQQQLPVQPLIDQLLLSLSRAEGISGTYIRQVTVEESETESVSAPSDEEDLELVPDLIENEEVVEPLPPSILMEGLKTIRLHVTVRTKDYEGIARFTEEIDGLTRLMNIDSISYTSPKERMLIDDETGSLEFTIVVSAFYFPGAAELTEETPTIDYPNPAKKRTPFYQE